MQDTAGDLQRIRDEHLARIFASYEGRAKAFRNAFAALIGFALIFFFLVLLPFAWMQGESHRIAQQQEVLRTQITMREQGIQGLQKPLDGIRRLRDEIHAGPNRLRLFILSLPAEPPPEDQLQRRQTQSPAQVAPIAGPDARIGSSCASQTGDEWLSCGVRQRLETDFANYQSILEKDVAAPLATVGGGFASLIDAVAVQGGLRDLQARFEAHLREDPEFWRTLRGKTDFYDRLAQEVDRFWQQHGASIEGAVRQLDQELKKLRDEVTKKEQQQATLREDLRRVAARLDQIQFPFGKIPAGLNESIAVFPILLAIGFVACASLLADTTRLRGILQTFYQAKDPGRQILTDQQVALVAPLWVDPLDAEQRRPVQMAVLAMPGLVFVAACGLILYSWTIPGSSGPAGVSRIAYGSLYAGSLAAFVYGFSQVLTAVRKYGAKETQTSTFKGRPTSL